MFKADRDGLHPLYHERDWQYTERRQQRQNKKTNWLSKGGYDTVIMVNPTPGGELARQLQKVVMDNPGPVKIKIQEQGGTQIKSRLQRTIPNKQARKGKGESAERTTLDTFYFAIYVGLMMCVMWAKQARMQTPED